MTKTTTTTARAMWTECAHCDTGTATHWTQAEDLCDPCCDACFENIGTTCDACGLEVEKTDLVDVCTANATRWEPAEYATACRFCCVDGPDEPDYDRMRDEADGY